MNPPYLTQGGPGRRSTASSPAPRPFRAYLATAVRACRAAGRIQRAAFGRRVAVEHKGEIDLVTAVDRRSEAAIVRVIRAAHRGHAVLAEEGGGPRGALAAEGPLWVVDPLDGTTNFSRGFPVFAVSVALVLGGRVVAAAVHQPLLGELFTAARGGGARLNGRRIGVTRRGGLDQAFLATGFPYDIRRSRRNNLDHFRRFATRCLAVRRAGAAALDLAYVAAGRFDGFWELKLRPWDIAAGALLVEEAGGTITGLDGRPWTPRVRDVVASNGRVHAAMLALLAGRRGGRAS